MILSGMHLPLSFPSRERERVNAEVFAFVPLILEFYTFTAVMRILCEEGIAYSIHIYKNSYMWCFCSGLAINTNHLL